MSQKLCAEGAERDELISMLREVIHEGDTVYTITRFRGRTGLMVIDPVIWYENEPRFYRRAIGRLIGYKRDTKRDGLITGGYGMDFGFEIVYRLSKELFGNGYKLQHQHL